MTAEAASEWRYAHIGFEGDDARIGGTVVWGADWRQVEDDPIELPHPAHMQEMHRYWIYEVGDETRTVRFAAGELSPNVWGFYMPDRS